MRRAIATFAAAAAPALLAAGLLAAPATAAPATAAPARAASPGFSAPAAPGGPGATSYLDLGRKDCLGTARNRASKVWYTVADGMLSDVYSPTTDNTNLKTLQYIVTDGHSFTDLQARDMTYTVRAMDRTGMACQVTATAKSGRYEIVTGYITDPLRDSVVMRGRYVPLTPQARRYHVYVRYDATINGNGGGGSQNGGADSATIDPATTALVSYDTNAASSYPPRNYEVPLYGALAANRPFTAASSGFVGTASDGLTELGAHHTLTPSYRNAADGNVEQTAEIDTSHGNTFTLALGYAQTEAASIRAAEASARTPFGLTYARYLAGWLRYDAGLRRPPAAFPGLTAAQGRKVDAEYWLSANVLKATEDKEFGGAVVSSLAGPWGQATAANTASGGKPDVDTNYRVIFARDFYETFTGFLADGDMATARAQVRFIFAHVQLPDGSFPRDSLVNGAVASDNYVLEPDEQAFPAIMAWEAGLGGDHSLYVNHIRPEADYLVAHGPAYGDERWEDQAGYSPSTIATEIAGLVAAGQIAELNHDPARAALYLATADDWQRSVKGWTVTTTGPYSSKPYFIRLSKSGDPDAPTVYNLGNGSISADQRSVIDAGFLELARFGELPASDPDILNSLPVVGHVLETDTPSGPGYHRYGTRFESVNGHNVPITGSTDGYGDCYAPAPMHCPLTGRPWIPWFTGTGHVWPLLNGERGEEDLQLGNRAAASRQLLTMANLADGIGMIPEQDWEDPPVPASPYGSDPTTASIGFTDGKGAGSAGEITWAQAQFVRLTQDIAQNRITDQPSIVRDRYVTHAPPVKAPLAITSPSGGAQVTTPTVTVTGTAAPGVAVVVAATLSPPGATQPNGTAHSAPVPSSITTVRADASGRFAATLPSPPGTWVITAATARPGSSGHARVSITSAG
ncbi:MAG TPA: glycoside hydrolase family 15 protein [Streptosporangiaceae bacterium]|nr:glycoside hydrolase family 15 protein [Streptosporangiaceae bacterium]